MVKYIFSKLESRALIPNIFLAIVVQTFFQVALIVVMSPKLKQYSSELMLDLRIFYSASEITRYFNELGNSGRQLYIYTEIIDLIYPVAYTITFLLLAIYLGKRAFSSNRLVMAATIPPLLLFLADFLENISTLTMLGLFPKKIFIYDIAGSFTLSKHYLLIFNLILLSVTGLLALKKGLFLKTRSPD